MDEITSSKTPIKRRRYSKEFKARIVKASNQPGASVAGVALANGLNANLVHKWRHQAKSSSPELAAKPDFLPLAMPVPLMNSPALTVTFEVAALKVQWPLEHIERSIAWLRALQA